MAAFLRLIGCLLSIGGMLGFSLMLVTNGDPTTVGFLGLAVPVGLLVYGFGRMVESF